MATFKITNPQVIGKLKLSAEVASKALQINASGELESSSVSTTELGYLSGVTSAIQTQLGNKANASDLSDHIADLANPHEVTKAQVGLSDVPNVDATLRANHTGTQLASTISDFSSAAKSAAVADSISDGVTDIAPSQNAVFDALALKISSSEKGANNGVATLDAGGKVPVSQLPNSVMEFKGVFDPASATFTDGTGNAGDVYLASVAGSYDAGSGSISYAAGDWAVHNGSIFQKSLNSNAVVSVNGETGIVVLDKADVGLGNVDNTSDATKNSANATLTNKTIDADNNTISNIEVDNLKTGVLDTDLSSVSASHDTIPSAKATKDYVDAQIGAGAVSGDIAHSSFSAANNQTSAANVTGLAFAAGTVRSFKAQVSVSIDATTGLNEVFELSGIQLASGFVMASTSVGDDSGVVFTITSVGQVQYTSQNSAGFVSNTIKFRAQVTQV